MFWLFDLEACGNFVPQPGIEPVPLAVEGKVLTTGPPGKSPRDFFKLDPFLVKKKNVIIKAAS